MKKTIFGLALACMFLFVGCSDKNKAKSIVTQFLEDNLNEDFSSSRVLKFDSTKYISKDQIANMQKLMGEDKAFKKSISYQPYNGKKLYYVRLQYKQKANKGKEKTIQTFYIDNEYKGVVAFKNN